MDNMAGWSAIRAGSFTVSVRRISRRGLPSAHAYSSGAPNRKVATRGRSGSSDPARSRPRMPSPRSSVHTPSPVAAGQRRRRSIGNGTDAQLEGGTIPRRRRPPAAPMACDTSSTGWTRGEGSGASTSTARSMSSTSTSASPPVVGIRGLTWATTSPPTTPDRLDGGGQEVHLDTQGHDTVPRRRDMEEHGVGGATGGEQARDEGEPHREVVHGRVVADARPDERGLRHDPRPTGPPLLGVEDEEAARGERPFGHPQQLPRRGEVARHDEPRLGTGERGEVPTQGALHRRGARGSTCLVADGWAVLTLPRRVL